MTEVVTFGEAMISFRSTRRLTIGAPVTPGVAGAESNVAIGLARLGHAVSWVGRVGADVFGDLVLRELRAEGVDTGRVVVDGDAPTGLMFLESLTADVSRVEYRRSGSAGSRLSSTDVEAAITMTPRVLHATGITPALSAVSRDATLAAVRSASAAGVFVSLDVNYRERLWDRETASETLRQLTRHANLVVASEDELALVADGDEESAVGALIGVGVQQVAVKRGAAGASLWTRAGRLDCPANQVTAVDTVGAGDAFCAGFLSAWLDGLDGAECLQRGNALGAFAVSTPGDWEGLPTRAELDRLGELARGDTLR